MSTDSTLMVLMMRRPQTKKYIDNYADLPDIHQTFGRLRF